MAADLLPPPYQPTDAIDASSAVYQILGDHDVTGNWHDALAEAVTEWKIQGQRKTATTQPSKEA